MKRKILKDIDCMGSSGWVTEDSHYIEYPECWGEVGVSSNSKTIKCQECGAKLSVERGVQYMMRLRVKK